MDKISPCLWFDGNAEEAMNFYLSVFKDARVTDILRWGEGGMAPAGTVLTCSFELQGQTFTALNGGPQFKFTPAISFFVDCEDQAEVDELWDKLLAGGGKPSQCGWLDDRFGVSWQIVPKALPEMLRDPDPARAQRTMQAMMKMVKLDVAVLKQAYEG